ncbi:S41 family peptidase [Leeuwenhoekiella sp. NPDC079379]|uniref:S41 family peptidase n=1 Tax=Leeuwenhoekiella sp. NPDC079379 TaxID=3364122 RepID=UPI0037C4F563
MKKYFLVSLLAVGFLSSCSSNDDTAEPEVVDPVEEPEPTLTRDDFEVQDFMYQAMNEVYLYKAQVPVLANDAFSTEQSYVEFLSSEPDPSVFFENILADIDRFSFATEDYVSLENAFSGVSRSDGIKLSFVAYVFEGTQYAAGIIRYVAPNSPASDANLNRGQAIMTINGNRLTISGNSLSSQAINLLSLDNYTLGISSGFDNAQNLSIATSDVSISKIQLTENPILVSKTLDINGTKIGYLMYNSFVSQFDDELNAAFADFKADGVQELVLDLRYNGGGSVASAIDLCSMITGQYNEQILIKQRWNAEYQAFFESQGAETLLNRFNATIFTGTPEEQPINSLNLSRLYVIGLKNYTASASELTTIGLEPYIDVQLIGNGTVGKFEASTTLYDSSNFGRENANPNHTYAVQPLIFTYANANDRIGEPSGLIPDFAATESLENLGTLGDPDEPLLKVALDNILGRAATGKSFTQKSSVIQLEDLENTSPTYQRMYVDKVPQIKK